MKNHETNKIYETADYSRFELHELNRDVKNLRKLESLRKSMRRHGFLSAYPLHTNLNGKGKLKIKAGHHRFEAARSLGLQVKYVVINDDATIQELEDATNPWSLRDYLDSYVRKGIDSYLRVKEYHERTGIPLKCCISMLGGEMASSYNKGNAFKRGIFQVKDMSKALEVESIVKHTKNCGISWATNTKYVEALSRIVYVNEFDRHIFKKKLKAHTFLMEKQPNLERYIEMIENIYNRQNQNKIPLTFLADEAAKMRNKGLSKL